MKKISWIVALLLALSFSLFIGCGADYLEPPVVTYTEYPLGDIMNYDNGPTQKGWATDGHNEATQDLGFNLADFQSATQLQLVLAQAPKGGVQLIWGFMAPEGKAGELGVTNPGWCQVNATENDGSEKKGFSKWDGDTNTLTLNMKAMSSYDKYKDQAIKAIKLLVGYYSSNIADLGIVSASLLIPDDFEKVTSIAGMPTAGKVGVDLVLPPEGLPAAATNKAVVYTLKSFTPTGGTKLEPADPKDLASDVAATKAAAEAKNAALKAKVELNGNVLHAKDAGSAVVSVVIKSGTAIGVDYTETDKTIAFTAPDPTTVLRVWVDGAPQNVIVTPWTGMTATIANDQEIAITPNGWNQHWLFQVNLNGKTQADIKEVYYTVKEAVSDKHAKVQFSNAEPGHATYNDYMGESNFNVNKAANSVVTFMGGRISGTSNVSNPFVTMAIHDGNGITYTFCDININTFSEKEEPFVAVTNITGAPGAADLEKVYDLSGVTVIPSRATNKDIEWSLALGSTVIPMKGNARDKFMITTADGGGVYTLTAKIEDGIAPGEDYEQKFNLLVDFDFPTFAEAKKIGGMLEPGSNYEWAVDALAGTELMKFDDSDYFILATVLAGDTSGFGNMQFQLQGDGVSSNSGEKGKGSTGVSFTKTQIEIVYLVFDLASWDNYTKTDGWRQFRINYAPSLTSGIMQAYFFNGEGTAIGAGAHGAGAQDLVNNNSDMGSNDGSVYGFVTRNVSGFLTEE